MNIVKFQAFIEFINIMNDGDKLYLYTTESVKKWYSGNLFNVSSIAASKFLTSFDLSVYSKVANQKEFYEEIELFLNHFDEYNIGHAIAPFLIIWNAKRFSEYIKRNRNFSMVAYFSELGKYLELNKLDFIKGHDKSFFNPNIDGGFITSIYNSVSNKLKSLSGIGHNEFIGTVKLLNVLYPNKLPILDTPIRNHYKLESNIDGYFQWCFLCQQALCSLEVKFIKEQESKGVYLYRQLDLLYMHYLSHGRCGQLERFEVPKI